MDKSYSTALNLLREKKDLVVKVTVQFCRLVASFRLCPDAWEFQNNLLSSPLSLDCWLSSILRLYKMITLGLFWTTGTTFRPVFPLLLVVDYFKNFEELKFLKKLIFKQEYDSSHCFLEIDDRFSTRKNYWFPVYRPQWYVIFCIIKWAYVWPFCNLLTAT